jgi:hypothetical protein
MTHRFLSFQMKKAKVNDNTKAVIEYWDSPTPNQLNSAIHEFTLSYWDMVYFLLIMDSETAIIVTH